MIKIKIRIRIKRETLRLIGVSHLTVSQDFARAQNGLAANPIHHFEN